MFGQNSIQKVVLIVIMILLVLSFLLPSVSHYVRYQAYKWFQVGIHSLLNYQTKHFYVWKSENFIIKYSDKDKDSISQIAEMTERYYAALNEKFADRHESEKILMVIYPDQESLNRSFGWAGDKSIDGVYWAGSIRLVSMSDMLDDLPISHELTHLLIDEWTRGNYTRWLSEGLAQYFEDKIAGYRLDEPLPEEKKKPYSLEQLGVDFDRMDNQMLAYWQSLQTVDYLISQYGIEKMQDMLTTLGEGTKTEQALKHIYGLDINELEKKTAIWISLE